jgi:hypothetical protein
MTRGLVACLRTEAETVEELRMHLAWRWFTGLGFDQEFPYHSTFSKNRHLKLQSLHWIRRCGIASRGCRLARLPARISSGWILW